MRRPAILQCFLFSFLFSANYLYAQAPTPPPKINLLRPHFPRVPGVAQLPLPSATQKNTLGVGLASVVSGSQTTNSMDLVKGIMTNIDNLDVLGSDPFLDPKSSIHTFVQAVTYAQPVEILRTQDGLDYFEVAGTIQGIGWGGLTEDLVNLTDASNFSPYSYQVQFVLRYTKDFDGTLVVYGHSAWYFSDVAFLENMFGPQGDDARHLEREGDLFVSDAVVSPQRNHAYFSINSLVKADASPAAIALSGPNQGQPLMVWLDVPIWRDTTQVAQRLLAKLAGKAVNLTVGTGFSAGAFCSLWANSGYSFTLDYTPYSASYRTGGVYRKAYDQTSGKIFDGFTPYAGACADDVSCRTNPEGPMGSPMTIMAGEAEGTAYNMVHNAAALQRAGVDVANSLRIYQFRTMAHNPPEAILVFPHAQIALEGPPYPPNPQGWSTFGMSVTSGDWLEPVMAKVIDNMVAHLKWAQELPPSLIDGIIVAGSPPYVDYPEFSRLPGSPPSHLYSQVVPFVDDPSLDSMDASVAQYSTATEADFGWSLVDDMNVLRRVMPNRQQALTLPLTACRQGGFIDFDWVLGFPGPFPNMKMIWKRLDYYNNCVQQTISDAVALGVYDQTIGEQVAQRTSPAALFK